MNERAIQAASAGQQTVDSGSGAAIPIAPEAPRTRAKTTAAAPGLTFPRFFTDQRLPVRRIEWETRRGDRQRKRRRGLSSACRDLSRTASHQHRRLGNISAARSACRASAASLLIGRVVDDANGDAPTISDEDDRGVQRHLKHILVIRRRLQRPVWFNPRF